MGAQVPVEPVPEYSLHIDTDGARLLKKCVDLYLERWPGGDPIEQLSLFQVQSTLTAIILENTLLK